MPIPSGLGREKKMRAGGHTAVPAHMQASSTVSYANSSQLGPPRFFTPKMPNGHDTVTREEYYRLMDEEYGGG